MQESRQKHVPIRTCIATGNKLPKRDLLRLVRVEDPKASAGYTVHVDAKGKVRGRGANITPSIEAFDIAIKKGAIERALKLKRKLSEAEVSALREEFANTVAEREFRGVGKKVVLKVSKEEFERKLQN